MYDPTASDSPHLSGIQPDWRDLPHVCEIIHVFWQLDDEDNDEIRNRLMSMATPNKIEHQLNFISKNKLGLIDENGNLTPDGIWLANQFTCPSQQRLVDNEVSVGAKSELNDAEQALLQSILFRRDWIPMLATINQLLTEPTSIKETDTRATEFRKRVDHLSGYANVNSINSWKKKAQAHFTWAESIGLAEESEGVYEATALAHNVDENLRQHHHPDWPIR